MTSAQSQTGAESLADVIERARAGEPLADLGDIEAEIGVGTVVTWVMHDKYLYCALRTAVGWYSTSQHEFGRIPNLWTLLDILRKDETIKIQVSNDWLIPEQ